MIFNLYTLETNLIRINMKFQTVFHIHIYRDACSIDRPKGTSLVWLYNCQMDLHLWQHFTSENLKFVVNKTFCFWTRIVQSHKLVAFNFAIVWCFFSHFYLIFCCRFACIVRICWPIIIGQPQIVNFLFSNFSSSSKLTAREMLTENPKATMPKRDRIPIVFPNDHRHQI